MSQAVTAVSIPDSLLTILSQVEQVYPFPTMERKRSARTNNRRALGGNHFILSSYFSIPLSLSPSIPLLIANLSHDTLITTYNPGCSHKTSKREKNFDCRFTHVLYPTHFFANVTKCTLTALSLSQLTFCLQNSLNMFSPMSRHKLRERINDTSQQVVPCMFCTRTNYTSLYREMDIFPQFMLQKLEGSQYREREREPFNPTRRKVRSSPHRVLMVETREFFKRNRMHGEVVEEAGTWREKGGRRRDEIKRERKEREEPEPEFMECETDEREGEELRSRRRGRKWHFSYCSNHQGTKSWTHQRVL